MRYCGVQVSKRQQKFLDLAQSLASQLIIQADAADITGAMNPVSVQALRTSGFLKLTVSKNFGGFGANLHEYVQAQSCVAMADASVALMAAMTAHVVGSATETELWPASLLEFVGCEIAAGKILNAIASEPELGSPSRGGKPKTIARKLKNGYALSGRKTWATGGSQVDYWLVTAGMMESEASAKFLVAANTTGISVDPTWQNSLSLRASEAHDVVFQNVFVPDNMVVPPGKSSPAASAWFWSAIAATYLGVGFAALEEVTNYARTRTPTALAKPIASLPGVQQKIGAMFLQLQSAQTMLHSVTENWVNKKSDGADLLPLLAGAKLLCTNAATDATDLALRVAGGNGITKQLRLERFFRDARAGLVHPPSDELTLELLGRANLKL